MSESLKQSIEELKKKLSEQEAEVVKTKNAINVLCEALGGEPLYKDLAFGEKQKPTIRPDEYFGSPFATAVRKYLEFRGEPVSVKEIVEGLSNGGFDFKKTKDRERAVSISLGKNSQTFVQLPDSDFFGLLEWYPDVKRNSKKSRVDKLIEEEIEKENDDLNDEKQASIEKDQ